MPENQKDPVAGIRAQQARLDEGEPPAAPGIAVGRSTPEQWLPQLLWGLAWAILVLGGLGAIVIPTLVGEQAGASFAVGMAAALVFQVLGAFAVLAALATLLRMMRRVERLMIRLGKS